VTAATAPREAVARSLDDIRMAVVPWALARVIVLVTLQLTRHVVNTMAVSPRPIQVKQGLLAWDAAYYGDIAEHGYRAVPKEGLRFFPLLPLLGRVAGLLPGVSARSGVVIVGNAAALIAIVLLVRYARLETGDNDLARRAAWFAALAPPAFVLVMGYAEALLMLLAIATALAVRSQRWWWAAAFAYLAGLTRPTGVLLAVLTLVAVVLVKSRRGRFGQVASVLAAPAGLFTYLLWVRHRTGSLFYALRVQENSHRRGKIVDPVTNISHAFHQLVSGDRFGSGLHVATAVIMIVLLVVLVRRWSWPITAYAFASFVLLLTASNLDSLERYALATFPFILAAATLIRPQWERVTWFACGAGLVGLSVLAFTGAYVP
jgi:Gpi18-like mannosyltransferase